MNTRFCSFSVVSTAVSTPSVVIQVSVHSGFILGLELPVGILSFLPARAVLVKTDLKGLCLVLESAIEGRPP